MSMAHDLRELVEQTPLVDTHEHLWDESTRLKKNADGEFLCDFSALFFGYPTADLLSAGMPKPAGIVP